MDNINLYFGNNLRKFREEKHLTQEEFAEKCNISRAYYGRLERGEHSISLDLCKNIADYLGIHISALFLDLPI
ncbi:helix-turn-helix domain-containing protein [Clostridium perfringens]|uniref:helix-turn-helix domain-containing protein n=1 Tax=Clostridium perfringens TaxID=1502 RepID=UPI002A58E98D|nr:helix-turn-helix transcriptional regulator [Clostridium perfringens]